MTIEKQPLVSIAMTVFNAKPYLAKTLSSLLNQEYTNFELIISDNASEDGSGEICQEFANRDNRIKYYRNTTNMGPARNSYKAVDLCSGDFIMPAADHDLYHPAFISSLLGLLQQDESVVLAYPRSIYIDEDDQAIELMPDVVDTSGLSTCQRISKIIWECGWMNMVYGLYRSTVFKTVWHTHPTIGPDHIIIAKLSLLGSIAQFNEPLFFRRRNRPVEDTQECTQRQAAWFVNSNYEALIPWTRMAYEHLKVIAESKLEDRDKEFLYEDVRKCFPTRFGQHMRKEVKQLLTEGPEILASARSFPTSFDVIKSEIARVAYICSFFYPGMTELDALIAGSISGRLDDRTKQFDVKRQFPAQPSEFVSVVIPAYNRADILTRAVISVLNQTYPVHEVIIADDGSTDDTEAVVRSLMREDNRVRFIPKLASDTKGAQAARNRGIKAATGEWIAFLDSDDEFLPDKIAKQLAVALSENVPVVHCECILHDVTTGTRTLRNTPALQGNCHASVLSGDSPTFPGMLVKKSCLAEIGFLDEHVVSYQEWETAIRLSALFPFGFVAEPLFIYNIGDSNAISAKPHKRTAEGWSYIVEKHALDVSRVAGKNALARLYKLGAGAWRRAEMPVKASLFEAKSNMLLERN